MRRTPADWRKGLEWLFREAVYTLSLLPMSGVRPMTYKVSTPTPVRSRDESYGWDRASKPRPVASPSAISRMDLANRLVNCADLTELQRNLIWDRACRIGWKTLEIKYARRGAEKIPARTLQRQYHYALAEIVAYAIANKRKFVSHRAWRTFDKKAA